MPGSALSLSERISIQVAVAGGHSVVEIADELDRSVSTVRRELARNGGRHRYRAETAQRRATRMRRRAKLSRLEADPELAAHVANRLRLGDSPMTIALELRRRTDSRAVAISHECIYQAIYNRRGLHRRARLGLHLRRRRRKQRCVSRNKQATHSLGNFRPIAERPAIALSRIEVGHLEGDLIVGANNKSAMITLFDRASRRCWLAATTNKSADAVTKALIAVLKKIPLRLRRTLTWDQGAEIAGHREIAKRCGIDIYIADKNSPWQRPTNENGNAFIRRYVGKGTDLNAINNQRRAWIEHRINTTPRRSLNWQTALEAYDRLSAPTP